MSEGGLARRSAAAVAALVPVVAAILAAPARAGVEEGRVKAEVCVACHGSGGNSTNPVFPSIAAQPRQFNPGAVHTEGGIEDKFPSV